MQQDANGCVEAIAPGETYITAITLDGGHTSSILVVVSPKPVSVEGIYTDIGAAELELGETITVNATILPEDATNTNVVWTTSNSSVATVNNGVITAVGAGTATITVTTVDGGYQARVFIEVTSDVGMVSGRVYNASTNALLSNVQVSIYKNGVLIATTQSNSSGVYSFSDLVYGDYELVYEKDGFISAEYSYTVWSPEDQLSNIYLTYDSTSLGYVSGYAVDAVNGSAISGITVYVRSGYGVTTGSVIQTLTTNSSGYYITSALEPGNYTLQFVDNRGTATTYTSTYINVVVSGGTTSPNNNATLSVPIAPDSLRIVLTWGSTPDDLDSHLTIEKDGSTLSHVYYSQKSGSGAVLDTDDTSAYGPETITISSFVDGAVYNYYVHNYSSRSSSSSTVLSNSNAKVTVYFGEEVYELNVPTGAGIYWNVFTYNSATGELTINNTITSSEP